MHYIDYRDYYKTCEQNAFFRRFLAIDMPCKKAQAYAIGRGIEKKILTMDDLLTIHQLCVLEGMKALDFLSGLPKKRFKKEDDEGCAAEDAHALTADFVQECNAFGRNNPLFYGAYLIGSFCHIAPFEQANAATALALCNFYLASRSMPPIAFCDMEGMIDACAAYCEQENIKPLNTAIAKAAEETFSVFLLKPTSFCAIQEKEDLI